MKGRPQHPRSVSVGTLAGLHARPAALIAEAADALATEVQLAAGSKEPVDAQSPLLIMSLGASYGAVIDVIGENRSAVDAIAAMIEVDLDSRR